MIATHQGQLLTLLTDTQAAMARLFARRASHLGLTRPQWRVVAGLFGRAGTTQTELSERIAIARSPLGKIVDQLERFGYVERRNDPDDRRVNRLFLTEEVEPLIRPALALARELEAQVLRGLPESGSLVDLLSGLSVRLHALIEEEVAEQDLPGHDPGEVQRVRSPGNTRSTGASSAGETRDNRGSAQGGHGTAAATSDEHRYSPRGNP